MNAEFFLPSGTKNHAGIELPVSCRMVVSGKTTLRCMLSTLTSSAEKSHLKLHSPSSTVTVSGQVTVTRLELGQGQTTSEDHQSRMSGAARRLRAVLIASTRSYFVGGSTSSCCGFPAASPPSR